MAIANRYELMYYVSFKDCNPNGDPDMGNTPRVDPQTLQGYLTDVSTKRRIRNYIDLAYRDVPGMNIMIQQSVNLNRRIAEVKQAAGIAESTKKSDKNSIYKARQKACELYYDVRTFGAVMSTGPNAGQVRGPVQFTFGRSLDPILPMDISITRMAVAKGNTLEEAIKAEEETPEDELRTMGRKQLIPFGLYEVRGFISANLAQETGFDDEDLKALFEAILGMYEHDHSASKGEVSVVSPLILFKHVGTDTNAEQRARQARLGCAPAHRLFDLVHVKRKEGVEYPRSYRDYVANIDLAHVPAGVEVGFQREPFGKITWGHLPEDEDWLRG